MKNIPKRIYLQIDADGEIPDDFNELYGVTWSTERIHPNDIEYVLPEPIILSVKEIVETNERIHRTMLP